MIKTLWLIFLLVLVFAGCFKKEISIGFRCGAESYPGTIEIIEIQSEKLRNKENASLSLEKLLVDYEFTADKDANAPYPVNHFAKSIVLTKLQIERKNVKVGDKFQTRGTMSTGTCKPDTWVEDFEKWK